MALVTLRRHWVHFQLSSLSPSSWALAAAGAIIVVLVSTVKGWWRWQMSSHRRKRESEQMRSFSMVSAYWPSFQCCPRCGRRGVVCDGQQYHLPFDQTPCFQHVPQQTAANGERQGMAREADARYVIYNTARHLQDPKTSSESLDEYQHTATEVEMDEMEGRLLLNAVVDIHLLTFQYRLQENGGKREGGRTERAGVGHDEGSTLLDLLFSHHYLSTPISS